MPEGPVLVEAVPNEGELAEVEPGRGLPATEDESDRLPPLLPADESEWVGPAPEIPDEGELVAEFA